MAAGHGTQRSDLPGLALTWAAHSREAASCFAPSEPYSANPGGANFCPFLWPDATGRGHIVARSRRRTTCTFPCARRSKPCPPACPSSARGVRRRYDGEKNLHPRVREYARPGLKRRRFAAVCRPRQREAGKADRLFATSKSYPCDVTISISFGFRVSDFQRTIPSTRGTLRAME